jgi:ribonuclease VapC
VIVDSSALVAIVRGETDGHSLAAIVANTVPCRMSAASYLETAIVVDGARNPVLSRQFDTIIREMEIEVMDVTREQAEIARTAYRDFGRGSGHPANLNFGDCLSYALAKVTDEPLLFKGNAFGHTDVEVCSVLP